MKDELRTTLLKELDYLVRMMPIWTQDVSRTKVVYDATQSGEDFVKFLEAFYKSLYMKEKLSWLTGLLDLL